MKTYNPIKIISFVVLFYSLLLIVGWIFSIDALTGIFMPSFYMKFPTVLCFAFSAGSLFLMADAISGKKNLAQIIIPANALFIGLIMVTLLAAGLFKVNTGIDDLFIKESFTENLGTPGIPAVPTMLCFVLFCIASVLALFGTPRIKKLLVGFGFFIACIGVIGTLGYAINLPVLYFKFSESFTPMAINTAIMFVLLGIGVLLCGRQIKDDVK